MTFKVLFYMKNIQDYQQDIASIRATMERSVKFLSLSGLSGILAGIYAITGTILAYHILYYPNAPFGNIIQTENHEAVLTKVLFVAGTVLILAISTAYLLSMRNAKKAGINPWSASSKQMLLNLLIPLCSGGLFILILLSRGYYGLLAPASLIFYGLALIFAGEYTFREIRYLGFCQLITGLIAALLPAYGLIFWAAGFGILHIVYGSIMYYRHEK